ncbi:acyl carrier protein [Actinoplanes aureus]|jgi:acyl carrier protein|uniref:Acyl carrier protein n=1 Tax=Actinoplanes aureus TaxID=2792083 RepID=A0A931C0V0_9ACTN|nr:acyl carrier protein [Actinoplanes aureus]MBG0560224.1 acyl carrier protein [Actinoplanes aureus]
MGTDDTSGRAVLVHRAWSEHLGAEAAQPRTNFFEAGGNSLMAASLIGRLSEELDEELPLGLLTRHPTLGELSAAVSHWPEPVP